MGIKSDVLHFDGTIVLYSCFVCVGVIFVVLAQDKENACASNSFEKRVYNFPMNS